MAKKYRVIVFGKEGCPKCKTLNKRLDSLLAKPDWQEFEKKYMDVETEEGLVEFCNAECINPQRIPAFTVAVKEDDKAETYELLPNPSPDTEDSVCGDSKLYSYLGLQTDYTSKGNGVITPRMIASVLEEAKSMEITV